MAVEIPTSKSLSGFNLTPMIDCVFLLLIFFLVATQLADEDRELEVKLPVASQAKPMTAKPKELFINIDRQGRYVVSGRAVSPQELRAIVSQAAVNNPLRQAVQIYGDKNSPLQSSAYIFDLCREFGIRDYALSTEAPTGR